VHPIKLPIDLTLRLLQISGLARRLHENTSLGDIFERLVIADPVVNHDILRLTRRVATRWNADLACVRTHNRLENSVQAFTGQSSNKCSAYRLSPVQWSLARHLEDLLEASHPRAALVMIMTTTLAL
jgi:hypothetical protein